VTRFFKSRRDRESEKRYLRKGGGGVGEKKENGGTKRRDLELINTCVILTPLGNKYKNGSLK